MTNETKHTPTPWALDEYKSVVDEKGQTVLANGFSMVMSYGEDQKVAKANAAHIVKCVNMYDELVEALKKIIDRSHNDPLGTSKVIDMRKIAESALKKAGAL